MGPIINRCIPTSILVFQDTVRCHTVSVLMNHLHANSHLWQTLLFKICFELGKCACKVAEIILNINRPNVLKLNALGYYLRRTDFSSTLYDVTTQTNVTET